MVSRFSRVAFGVLDLVAVSILVVFNVIIVTWFVVIVIFKRTFTEVEVQRVLELQWVLIVFVIIVLVINEVLAA